MKHSTNKLSFKCHNVIIILQSCSFEINFVFKISVTNDNEPRVGVVFFCIYYY